MDEEPAGVNEHVDRCWANPAIYWIPPPLASDARCQKALLTVCFSEIIINCITYAFLLPDVLLGHLEHELFPSLYSSGEHGGKSQWLCMLNARWIILFVLSFIDLSPPWRICLPLYIHLGSWTYETTQCGKAVTIKLSAFVGCHSPLYLTSLLSSLFAKYKTGMVVFSGWRWQMYLGFK